MAYFLKKTRNKKGLYLQIYESHWDPKRGHTVNRSVRAVGYEHELKASGIEDPISHFKAEVAQMNAERKAAKKAESTREIGEEPPQRHLGHFAIKAIDDALGVSRDLGYLQIPSGFRFSLADLLSSLVCARVVAPCSKSRTFHDVVPLMEGVDARFSLNQLYDGLAYLGEEYEKVIEIYNERMAGLFPRDTSCCYFDCTNFYFEIDREDGLRRKGPSKEHRSEPIVSMGLLLDSRCIPISMSVFAGNESERPQLREVIGKLKERHAIVGRTVRIADKGLNCADNVADSARAGDGYIFSRSIRTLAATERAWALAGSGWKDVSDKKGTVAWSYKEAVDDFEYVLTAQDGGKRTVRLPEKRVVTYSPSLAKKQTYEINRQVEKARALRLAAAKRSEYGDSARYVTFAVVDAGGEPRDDGKVVASLNHDAIRKAKATAGYNMLVTSETKMSAQDICGSYHQLWRIEESFRVMKSELDARPAYLQRPSSITAHFLICYLAVLLVRLLQVNVLDDAFCSEEIMEVCRGLDVCQVSDRKYVNVSRRTPLMEELAARTGLPLLHFNLSKGDVRAIAGCTLRMLQGKQTGPLC
ncbi:IS1634 family transposase [Olsenella sp. Marseille-P4559]|uniref:IS1634 family transposase n=1 Tax=Olsenella sp. Marseille-P4559 TaxID=2364795 RepID=UPI001A917B69|nr:IS1634 family transposase [Olsenella sp. Marseille-P4559]